MYQCKNAFLLNIGLICSFIRWNTSAIEVELAITVADDRLESLLIGISQQLAIILCGIHYTNWAEFLFITFTSWLSTSCIDIPFPLNMHAAV